MGAWHAWFRVIVTDSDGVELGWTVGGEGRPDLGVVDAVARFALIARRSGALVGLSDVSPAMRELLDIAGLDVGLRRAAEDFG